MASHARWTAEKVAWARSEVGSGRSRAEVAAELGVSPGALRARLRRPAATRYVWTDEAGSRAREMRRGGATLSEIADAIGCSVACVSSHLRGAGGHWVPRKTRVELTDDEEATAMAMYAAGSTIQDIASELHHDTRIVAPVVWAAVGDGRLAAHRTRRPWCDAEDALLRHLVRHGATQGEAALALGRGKTSVRNRAAALGLTWRGSEERRTCEQPGPQEPASLDPGQRRAALATARRLWQGGATTLTELAPACADAAGVTEECMRRELPRLLDAEWHAMRRHHVI
ncbi:MAG: hypothetical protein ACI360_08490 [Atopobiaceae bacterium]